MTDKCVDCNIEDCYGICIKCKKSLCSGCATIHLKKHRSELGECVRVGTYNKKQARMIIEDVLERVRMSKMDRTFFLIELLEKNKIGGFS